MKCGLNIILIVLVHHLKEKIKSSKDTVDVMFRYRYVKRGTMIFTQAKEY